jgi:hypothetical protein
MISEAVGYSPVIELVAILPSPSATDIRAFVGDIQRRVLAELGNHQVQPGLPDPLQGFVVAKRPIIEKISHREFTPDQRQQRPNWGCPLVDRADPDPGWLFSPL